MNPIDRTTLVRMCLAGLISCLGYLALGLAGFTAGWTSQPDPVIFSIMMLGFALTYALSSGDSRPLASRILASSLPLVLGIVCFLTVLFIFSHKGPLHLYLLREVPRFGAPAVLAVIAGAALFPLPDRQRASTA